MKQSDHYMSMLPANDSTVKGNFNNITFTADGITSKFYKKGSKFFINTEGSDGKNYDFEVKYIFGYEPLQQYLVQFPGGRMQVPSLELGCQQKKMVQPICRSKNTFTRLATLDRKRPKLEYHVRNLPFDELT